MFVLSPIKIILVSLILITYLFYFLRVRSQLLHRMLGTLFLLAAVFLILFPGVSNVIASAFGVGRGVDLIIYIMFCFFLFLLLLFYNRILMLERQMTLLTRGNALSQARVGKNK